MENNNSENNQNKDLIFKNLENLTFTLEALQKNLKEIIKLKQKNNDISESIDIIEKLLSLIKTFINKNHESSSNDVNINKEFNNIKEQLEKYFNNNEEIKNFIKIIGLINNSKDILETFNFNPPPENFNEESYNNSFLSTNNISENLFLVDISEEKQKGLENDFSYIKSENEVNNNNIIKININNDDQSSLIEARKTFIENFMMAINLLISKFDIIASSKENNNFPLPDYVMTDFQYLEWIWKLNSNIEYPNDYYYDEENLGTIENGLNNLKVKYFNNQDTNGNIKEECFEEGKDDNLNYVEIQKKLIYFINIISKENINLNKEYIKNISENISKSLGINSSDLFLIQNSPIDNFVKSLNFKEMTLNQNEKLQSFSKLNELKSIKYNFILKEFNIGENDLDNRGNFLYPNTRRSKYRGKEVYFPPYGWIGIGLKVLEKYENDNWLEDISQDSEWAVAYRSIALKNPKNMKMKTYLKDLIENQSLKNANVILKKGLNDSRHWKIIKSGIYMTPYIKIAEKYTQSISFDNKKYKVLLMAKVKISEIQQPKGSPFWLLNDEHIRIYRVLFKEFN